MWWSTASQPRSVDDCAWSRQKVTELQSVVRSVLQPVANGEEHHRHHHVVLLYGPSGCGKLVSVEPIVRSVVPGAVIRTHVMGDSLAHAEEQMEHFLLSALADGCAPPMLLTEPCSPPAEAGNPTPPCQLYVQVVKLLSFDSNSEQNRPAGRTAVARVLDCFMRALDRRYRDGAPETPAAASRPSKKILTILVHTVHDTHSDKVHLNDNFSSAFLQHPMVRKFHCTPVTEIAIKRRLTAVWEAVLRLAPLPSRRYLVSPPNRDVVARIAATCAGDIRQALQQLQWEAINPLLSSGATAKRLSHCSSPSTTQACSAAKEHAVDVDNDGTGGGGAQTAGERLGEDSDDCCDIPEILVQPIGKKQRPVRKKRPRADPEATVETLLGDAEEEWNRSGSAAGRQGPRQHPVDVLRNRSIDAGHASARLLTAKYDATEVLEVVTVPPGKLMNFVASNMHHYFSDAQVSEYASCAELLSSTERYFAPAEMLSEGAALDSGTAQSASLSSSQAESLSVVGFRLFVFGYRAIHKSVTPPKTFLSHAPLKYFPVAFPRFSDVATPSPWARERRGRASRSSRGYHTGLWDDAADSPEGNGDEGRPAIDVEDEVRLTQFLAALDASAAGLSSTALPIVEVVDALRRAWSSAQQRCGSAAEAAVDVLPLVGHIVVDRSSETSVGFGHVASFPRPALPSQTAAASRGPVKTLVKLTCVGFSPKKSECRPITRNQLLSLKILQHAALKRSGRHGAFRTPVALPFQLRAVFSEADRSETDDHCGAKDPCDWDPIEEA